MFEKHYAEVSHLHRIGHLPLIPVSPTIPIYHGIVNCRARYTESQQGARYLTPDFLEIIDENLHIKASESEPLLISFSKGMIGDNMDSFNKTFTESQEFSIENIPCHVYAEIRNEFARDIEIKIAENQFTFDTEEPDNASEDDFWYDMTNNYLKIYDSNNWVMPKQYYPYEDEYRDSYIVVLGKVFKDQNNQLQLAQYYPNKLIYDAWIGNRPINAAPFEFTDGWNL